MSVNEPIKNDPKNDAVSLFADTLALFAVSTTIFSPNSKDGRDGGGGGGGSSSSSTCCGGKPVRDEKSK